MHGKYYDLKKLELEACKEELKTLTPGTARHTYVKEQIDYILSDLFTIANENKSLLHDRVDP